MHSQFHLHSNDAFTLTKSWPLKIYLCTNQDKHYFFKIKKKKKQTQQQTQKLLQKILVKKRKVKLIFYQPESLFVLILRALKKNAFTKSSLYLFYIITLIINTLYISSFLFFNLQFIL